MWGRVKILNTVWVTSFYSKKIFMNIRLGMTSLKLSSLFASILPRLFCFVILASAFLAASGGRNFETDSHINAIIGNLAISQAENLSESEKIELHLSKVLTVLRSSSPSLLSDEQKMNRMKVLQILHEYAERGEFPINNHFLERKPIFIDDFGTVCAVGFLVEKTHGRKVAEAINQDFRFSKVLDMSSAELEVWTQEMGVHPWEAAMIQPQYSSVTTEVQIKISTVDLAISLGTTAMALSGGTYQLFYEPRPLVKRWIPMVGIGVGVTSLVHGVVMRRRDDVLRIDNESPFGMSTNYILEDNSKVRFMGLFNIAKGVVITSLNTYSLIRKTQNVNAQKNIEVSAIPLREGAILSARLSF